MLVIRSRSVVVACAAAVVSVVLTLVLVGAWRVDAAPGDVDATFVAMPSGPCRLADFRPGADNVGPKDTPLVGGETYALDVTGADAGDCANLIPGDASAVSLNVTAVGTTEQTNVRVFPGYLVEPPLVANLNPGPGQARAWAKVDVEIDTDGVVKFFNAKGSTYLVVEVFGYYTKSSLTEIAERLPVALGSMDASGELGNSSGVVSAGYNDVTFQYEIELAGLEYSGKTFVVSVTPTGSDCTDSNVMVRQAANGLMAVKFVPDQNEEPGDVDDKCDFQFVVFANNG